ncbi:hypothetical protein TNCV_196901 [Trichonephila clavipes]|uniref:Uncharacterized protein n=1 Tax=Trichonephila clavipes TaxID=2585209 RepID=A0A8X6WIW6_TRICX|nr:hypothetical protein TNCV_196901 [Trichonephila clavipes]
MPVVENVVKITEMIEVDRHVSSRSIFQELKVDHETVLNHFHKTGLKKKLDVWMPYQLTQKAQNQAVFARRRNELKLKQKLLDIRAELERERRTREVREQALPSEYHRQTYL